MRTVRLRALARNALLLPARALHAWRRRVALTGLRRRPRPRTVLFVCDGNRCRSPYAEAVARGRFPSSVVVESAGFLEADRPSPSAAVQVASQRGIDLSTHRSRRLELRHLLDTDLVVVMDERQRRRLLASRHEMDDRIVLLGDLDPDPATGSSIPDPVDEPDPVLRGCYDRVDRCVDALAGIWSDAP